MLRLCGPRLIPAFSFTRLTMKAKSSSSIGNSWATAAVALIGNDALKMLTLPNLDCDFRRSKLAKPRAGRASERAAAGLDRRSLIRRLGAHAPSQAFLQQPGIFLRALPARAQV